MSHKIDMIGKRFTRLVVVSEIKPHIKPSGQKVAMYKCLCDCGNYTIVPGTHLRSGHSQSCGCLKAEQKKHGTTRLARIWRNMIQRCNDPNSASYKRYGARGITVCDSWVENYEIFKLWAKKAGYEDGLTLDRIDNTKGYEPVNCRWATYKEQANNKSNNLLLTYKGETHTASEWADVYGIDVSKIYRRKSKGWSDDRIFNWLDRSVGEGRSFSEIAAVLEKMREGQE